MVLSRRVIGRGHNVRAKAKVLVRTWAMITRWNSSDDVRVMQERSQHEVSTVQYRIRVQRSGPEGITTSA